MRPAQPPLDITVSWQLRESWRALRLLWQVAGHVAAAEGFHSGSLSVVVVGARAMSTLHQRYRGQPGPTDVLAFDLGTERRRGILDGEIVLCADVARRRAGRRGLAPARAELALYLAHGVLHLAGYDDHSPAGFRRMHAREDDLLSELGLGRVFARGA
ncbi:MAG: rRNA maturation RNase YbeY [Phycisphaerae bacterium]|jgi:probable rRNA maturation factor